MLKTASRLIINHGKLAEPFCITFRSKCSISCNEFYALLTRTFKNTVKLVYKDQPWDHKIVEWPLLTGGHC